jgi:uncharacterized protein
VPIRATLKLNTFSGSMYDRPDQDYAAAVGWHRKAADQGYAGGQHKLGFMYQYGRGVPRDFISAHMWFNLAAAKGRNAFATTSLDMVAAKMTPAQIGEAEKRFAEWRPLPATAAPRQ